MSGTVLLAEAPALAGFPKLFAKPRATDEIVAREHLASVTACQYRVGEGDSAEVLVLRRRDCSCFVSETRFQVTAVFRMMDGSVDRVPLQKGCYGICSCSRRRRGQSARRMFS